MNSLVLLCPWRFKTNLTAVHSAYSATSPALFCTGERSADNCGLSRFFYIVMRACFQSIYVGKLALQIYLSIK